MSDHAAPTIAPALAARHAAGARLRDFLASPLVQGLLSVGLLAALGWLCLAVMVADMAASGIRPGTLGPGMRLIEDLLPAGGIGFLDALCRRGTALAGFEGGNLLAGGRLALLTFLAWCAMALGMMVPTATPMVTTYADIAEAARRKGEPVASPLTLIAGYLVVWTGFAAAATLLQIVLTHAGLFDPASGGVSGPIAAAVLLCAGAYQFSALKHACIRVCQSPFTFFFTNWTGTTGGVFRIGMRQGLYCLGCCWAMMMVMFAVGSMNVVWMAGLAIAMTVEKSARSNRFSRVIGVALIAVGILVAVRQIGNAWVGFA